MNIPAWFPWFWNDWKKSPRVMALSSVAKHAYRALIDSQWENGGKIPNQPKIFWKYADMESPEQWEAVAADVLQFFPAVEDGKFIANPKLAQEWDETQARMRGYSIGGQRSAEAKKRNKLASTLQVPCSQLATKAQHKDLDLNKELSMADAGASAEPVADIGPVKVDRFGITPAEKLADFEEVHAYWLAVMERNPKLNKFSKEKKRKISVCYEECLVRIDRSITAQERRRKAVELLKLCVDNMAASDFHMGRQPGKTQVYNDFTLLFRDVSKLEFWWNRDAGQKKKMLPRVVIDNSAADRELSRQLGRA